MSADISHHSSWTLKVTVTKSLRKMSVGYFSTCGSMRSSLSCNAPSRHRGQRSRQDRQVREDRQDTEILHSNLTFQVTCVGQISQFLRCLILCQIKLTLCVLCMNPEKHRKCKKSCVFLGIGMLVYNYANWDSLSSPHWKI